MAASLNKVCLIGNLGKDPEVKSFTNGGRIVSFSVATSENWTDKATGEKKEKTEWHNVTVTNDGLVGVVERYLKKGAKIYLEGKLHTRKWQDKDGADRYTTEIVLNGPQGVMKMLDAPPKGSQQQEQEQWSKPQGSASENPILNKEYSQNNFDNDLDDDVPF